MLKNRLVILALVAVLTVVLITNSLSWAEIERKKYLPEQFIENIQTLSPSSMKILKDSVSKDDAALAYLLDKCHNDINSTLTSTTYFTGDEEARKKDWLSSCYPIEISNSARSIGHCTGIFRTEYPIAEFFDMPNIRNYWMPNVEQAKKTQGRLLDSTHTLIAKTRAAYNIFTDFLKDRTGHIPKIAYIGHSSLDPLYHFGDQPLPPQSFTNVFHAYGHAGTKGTGALIKCWLRHPEWPTLSVLGNSNSEYNIGQSNNIKMISKVSINELGIIQRASAIHVYPTSREGFGHALNEARGSGALLVATDFGPMNEFVQEGYSGYLMKIDSENVESFQLFGTLRPVQVRMNSNDICNGMEKVFKTSMADRIRMGEAGRAGFLADRLYFTEMVKILKNEALRRFNGEEL